MPSPLHDPGQESTADHAHALIRALLSGLPVAGGAAVELFGAVFTPPLEKRRRRWMQEVGQVLADLQQNAGKVDIQAIAEDEEFTTLLLSATQLAIKNHRSEKLDALRNAVVNAACGRKPGDDKQTTFLGLIDSFTPLHLTLLHMFTEGFVWSSHGQLVSDELDLPEMLLVYVGSYREYRDIDRVLLSIVLRELISAQMIEHWIIDRITRTEANGAFYCTVKQWKERSNSELRVAHSPSIEHDRKSGNYVTRTTPFAKEFITFISRPDEVS